MGILARFVTPSEGTLARMQAAASLLIAALGLCAVHGSAAGDPNGSAPDQTSAARELLLEMTAHARLAGSFGDRRLIDICRRELEAAGWTVELETLEQPLHLPVRQDLSTYAGTGEGPAFAERFEVFDPRAIPHWPLPPVYVNCPTADVRGPVVDAGAGRPVDYERLAGQRIELAGTVSLVHSSADPAELVAAAEAAGAAALLIAAPPHGRGPSWPAGPWSNGRQMARDQVAPETRLPVAPILAREAEAILSRLRARRVRGADDKAQTIRVGPGPVEVQLQIETETLATRTQVLRAHLGSAASEGTWTLTATTSAYLRDATALTPIVALLDAAREMAAKVNGGGLDARHVPHIVLTPDGFRAPLKGLSLDLRSAGRSGVRMGAAQGVPGEDSTDDNPNSQWARLIAEDAQVAWYFDFGWGSQTDLSATRADGFTLVDRFLDPDLARTQALGRIIAFATEARARRIGGTALAESLIRSELNRLWP